MRKKVSLLPVIALIVCMISFFLWTSSQTAGKIDTLDRQYEQSRTTLSRVQNENLELSGTLEISGTDAFIEHQARSLYGYMKPNEIRLVITDPETLYGE